MKLYENMSQEELENELDSRTASMVGPELVNVLRAMSRRAGTVSRAKLIRALNEDDLLMSGQDI